jgi:hypothetical protein
MAKLSELARLIRSKNAGAFVISFDILFEDRDSYVRVRDSGKVTPEVFSKLFMTPIEDVEFFTYDAGLAIKASIPRPIPSGDFGDSDVLGGQQYGPLVDIEIP